MSEKECKDNALTSKQQLKIEGYKTLMQYGIQMSQDHVSIDRIFMPLSLVPAYILFTSSDIKEAGIIAELVVWSTGILLLLFWHLRNWRSRERLYMIWDTISYTETCLEFAVFSKVHDYMNAETTFPLRDFAIKVFFFLITIWGYLAILCNVLLKKFDHDKITVSVTIIVAIAFVVFERLAHCKAKRRREYQKQLLNEECRCQNAGM